MALDIGGLLERVFTPQPGERLLFLSDGPVGGAEVSGERKKRLAMVQEWHAAAQGFARDRHVSLDPPVFFRLDEDTGGALRGEVDREGTLSPLSAFLDSLGEEDILVVLSGPSLTAELFRRAAAQRFRAASAPGIRPGLPGFEAAYDRIPLRAEALNMRLDMADAARIRFAADNVPGFPAGGLGLSVDLRGQTYHVLENGECRMPGRVINLPSGCANIVPYPGGDDDRGPSRTAGEVPIDYNGRLVVLSVDAGRIADFHGEGEGIGEWTEKLADAGGSVLSKLGLGLNDDCRVVGVPVVDEKTMGLHLGFGPDRAFPCVYTEHASVRADLALEYPGGRRETVLEGGAYRTDLLGAVFERSGGSATA